MISKTGTSFMQAQSNYIAEQSFITRLCLHYGVNNIVKDFSITKERMTELFLLGASFSTETIRETKYDVMIMNKVMYILSMKE